MFAIGRKSCTTEIGLEKIKVKLDARNRVITVDNHEQTETENVFAIGDILANKPQLTPVAIKAGQLLARRLCGISFENCDYNIIPTTVFTPIEYGAIGFSEDDAKNRFGENDIDVFHSDCFPLEYKLGPAPETNWFYAKLITRISQNNKVIGFHVISPNAGEVTQGYAVAMQMGATLNDFNRTIGIHPTVSEIFTSMKNSKRLVPEVKPEGGC
ncbi:Thioredoxin reductase 1, cytoplasmic [Thelohanellus kitauei]|uniref:Thioredoxin reductase 1, cytoplasmic n=1 Tax=Thelohanellus kitauei TaxID=669202 RepID=A0A0C2MND0_THEKT|nr:Thioredoxin reductase 1, cytoplasmic [Thelohanellus kitauei]